MIDTLLDIFRAGGWVMYPLALMSLLSVTFIVERLIYLLPLAGSNAPDRLSTAMASRDRARSLAEGGRTVYHRFVAALFEASGDRPLTDAHAIRAVNTVRPEIDRFRATLATIITAAPLLGILGTVTGIIESFGLLGGETVSDPAQLASGISQALYTTAFGLGIAIATLFPNAIIRSRAQRVLSRLESIALAADDAEPDISPG
ncbi:MAG: MotA/TolQ/ExbB proton channel family protein [Planctomycetota bacterium]